MALSRAASLGLCCAGALGCKEDAPRSAVDLDVAEGYSSSFDDGVEALPNNVAAAQNATTVTALGSEGGDSTTDPRDTETADLSGVGAAVPAGSGAADLDPGQDGGATVAAPLPTEPGASSDEGESTPSSACGNGALDELEDCDPSGYEASACSEFGYESGTVGCDPSCLYDFSACLGVERCADGVDNDGDGLSDCADEDCSEACAATCGVSPEVVPDPSRILADNTGHATDLSVSCLPEDEGPEVAYAVVATNSGMLDASLVSYSDAQLAVSIRTGCVVDEDSVLACAASFASVPVEVGDLLTVVVHGASVGDVGGFELSVRSRPANVCGDYVWDPLEECDDVNFADGDGCNTQCVVETSETGDNGHWNDAEDFAEPFFGRIGLPGDEDYVRVEVPEDGATLIANVISLAVGGCEAGLFDPQLELFERRRDPAIAANDDYNGLCPRVIAEGLEAGTYRLRVSESPGADEGLRRDFPYELAVTVDWCGNDRWGPLEGCDDGNSDSGDGCSSDCEVE